MLLAVLPSSLMLPLGWGAAGFVNDRSLEALLLGPEVRDASNHRPNVLRPTMHGFKFVMPFSLMLPITPSGTLRDHWEMTLLFDKLLRDAPPDALMVDAGMNLGFFSLLSRKHGLRTLSIDIQSSLQWHFASSLNRSNMELRNSRIVRAAVSDRTLPNSFELVNLGKHQVAFGRDTVLHGVGNRSRAHSIDVVRLDDVVDQWYSGEEIYAL